MPRGPYGLVFNTLVSAAGIAPSSPGQFETNGYQGFTAQVNSSAGHVVIGEASLDGVNWAPVHSKLSETTTLTFLPTSPGIAAISETFPRFRFNVVSMTAATTLSLSLYGVPVSG